MEIGEITAPSARNKNLLAQAIGVLENRNAPPAFAGLNRAHQARCAAAENECVESMSHVRVDGRTSHIKKAEARNAIFLQQALVHVLSLQLFDLRPRHFTPIRNQVAVRFGADGNDLLVGG